MTYEDALKEIQAILHSLQNEQVPPDELAKQTQRAAELIRLCQKKLSDAEQQIDRSLTTIKQNMDNEE